MFLASKLLAVLIEPLFWVLLLLLAGVLLGGRRARLGRMLTASALLALLLGSWTSGPEALLRTLESRYDRPPEQELQHFSGVVVLGGALSSPELWEAHPQVGLNNQAERMTEAVALMRSHPNLQLLFTGGNAKISGEGISEAQRAKVFFDAMGVDPSRVRYESVSRNSYENALLTASMPGVDKTQRWLLLTSAFHLPRAMGVFTHAGWNVTPWPVDYRTTAHDSWFDFSLHSGPEMWELALHEWLGYAAYRMAGWL
jgi:uncharacterized SAM-binding protein YcdF (DUF218 family)